MNILCTCKYNLEFVLANLNVTVCEGCYSNVANHRYNITLLYTYHSYNVVTFIVHSFAKTMHVFLPHTTEVIFHMHYTAIYMNA